MQFREKLLKSVSLVNLFNLLTGLIVLIKQKLTVNAICNFSTIIHGYKCLLFRTAKQINLPDMFQSWQENLKGCSEMMLLGDG